MLPALVMPNAAVDEGKGLVGPVGSSLLLSIKL